jgi:hypothetical protein
LFVLQKTIQHRILLPSNSVNNVEALDVGGAYKDELFVPLFFSKQTNPLQKVNEGGSGTFFSRGLSLPNKDLFPFFHPAYNHGPKPAGR